MRAYDIYISPAALFHYGIKGMKWGVRRSKHELALAREKLAKEKEHAIIKSKNTEHRDNPKKSIPNSIMDKVDNSGRVLVRSYYDEKGEKNFDIHTTNHGNPKTHSFGFHGEHGHDYKWNNDGKLISKTDRELTETERKENADIL